jgi:hypothetical protein
MRLSGVPLNRIGQRGAVFRSELGMARLAIAPSAYVERGYCAKPNESSRGSGRGVAYRFRSPDNRQCVAGHQRRVAS